MLQTVLPLFPEEPVVEKQLDVPRPAAIAPKPQLLWLCLYFPELALEAVEFSCEDLAAVVEESGGRCEVFATSVLAREAGIASGMPMNAALALCPDLKIKPRQPLQEKVVLAGLGAWAEKFSSVVTLDGCSVLLEVRGSLKLFGSLKTLHRQVSNELEAQGLCFSAAAAPTPIAAKLLAQYGDDQVVARREQLRSVLGRLPIECLPLEEKRLKRLGKIGAQCLNDLFRLPRDGLARRFGPDLVQFLDQALGELADPRQGVAQKLQFESDVELYMETNNTGFILTAAEELFDRLVSFLLLHDAGVSRFKIKLFHQQRSASEVDVGLQKVCRDSERFLALLDEHLKHFLLPAPVISVVLMADEILPYASEKQSLFKVRGGDNQDWERVLEDLQSRLGNEAVQSLCCEDDHRPEHAWSNEVSADQLEAENIRPYWLLPEPKVLGKNRVELLQGPERIEGGWWDGDDVRRDYFKAQAGDGSRVWVFRDLCNGQWYLHGLFS